MKKIITIFFFCTCSIVNAQEIVNLVLVGKNGITEEIKEANSFIVVKKYPNGFQRLDYKLLAPLQKAAAYSDSTLTILEGSYYEYQSNGAISVRGYYLKNQKEKDWSYYNDTGKVILQEQYEKGILIKTINPDTVKKEIAGGVPKKDEKEAVFKKGMNGWIKYLIKNLNADLGNQSVNGGQVRVEFAIDTFGKCVDVHIRKSVEFILDEEAIRVIENSPPWDPAIQDGKNIKAYRVQPVTFAKQ